MNKQYVNQLKALAEETGLQMDSRTGTLFGVKNGYNMYLYSANESNLFSMSVAVSRGGELPNAAELNQLVKQSSVLNQCTVQAYKVTYTIALGVTRKKRFAYVAEAIETVTSYLASNQYINCCQQCGKTENVDAYSILGNPNWMCADCFAGANAAIAEKHLEQSQKRENIVAGIVGALLGALLGVAAIVVCGQLGYVAVISGIVMGVCTVKGYELLGKRISVKGIIICVVIMLGMVYLANQIDWAISAASFYETDVFTAFRAIPYLVADDYIEASTYYGNLAMVYIFTVVGAAPMIWELLRHKNALPVTEKMTADTMA